MLSLSTKRYDILNKTSSENPFLMIQVALKADQDVCDTIIIFNVLTSAELF